MTAMRRRFRRVDELPANYNLARRIFAAVAVQAVRDIRNRNVSNANRATAALFLDDYFDILVGDFAAPPGKLRELISAVEATSCEIWSAVL